MRNRRWIVLLACGLALAAGVGLYAQSKGGALATAGKAGSSSLFSAVKEGLRPQLTRLQIDLFELRCTNEQLARLDLMELAAGGEAGSRPMAASAAQVLERLRQLGDARLSVRYDNFVDLVAGCRLASGQRVPSVENVSISAGGVVVPSVRYERLGFITDVKGQWLEETEPNLAHIAFRVESSDLSKDSVDLGRIGPEGGINLPIFKQFDSQQQLVARSGLPVLLACNDLSTPVGADGKLAVLVARLVATRLNE